MRLRRLWPVFLVGTSHMVAVAAMTPLIPLLAVARGASPAMVGVVAGSAAVLPLLFGVWTGAGADVVGARRLTLGGSLLLTASVTLIAASSALWVLVAGAAIVGLANNVLILASQTSVAQASRRQHSDRNFGFFAFWISVGQLVGPYLGGTLADAASIQTALYASAALTLVPAFLALLLPGPPRARVRRESPLRALDAYRAAWTLVRRGDLRFVLSISFVIIFAWSIKSSFYPLYLQSVGLSKASIGLIFSLLGGGSMIVRPLVGAAAARFGRRRILLCAVLLANVAIGTIPFLRHFGGLAIAAVATGIAWGFTQPLTMSLMAGSVESRERGLALSLRMTSNRLAEVTSPMIFATLVSLAGLGSAFFMSAAALAAGVLVISRGDFDSAAGVEPRGVAPSGAALQSDRPARPLRLPTDAAQPAPPSPARPHRG
ncbi:MAG: MFS transporter [Armatimonadota bacterium]